MKNNIKEFYKIINGDHLYKLVNDYWKYIMVADIKLIKLLKENKNVEFLDLR